MGVTRSLRPSTRSNSLGGIFESASRRRQLGEIKAGLERVRVDLERLAEEPHGLVRAAAVPDDEREVAARLDRARARSDGGLVLPDRLRRTPGVAVRVRALIVPFSGVRRGNRRN